MAEAVFQEKPSNFFEMYNPGLSVNAKLSEEEIFTLMVDANFFVTSATDVSKLIKLMDWDCDGAVSLEDLKMFVDEGPVMERDEGRY